MSDDRIGPKGNVIDYDQYKPEDKWKKLKIPGNKKGKEAVPAIVNVIKRWLLEDSE